MLVPLTVIHTSDAPKPIIIPTRRRTLMRWRRAARGLSGCMQLRGGRYARDIRWKLTSAGDFFDMRDGPWSVELIPADNADLEVKAARIKLQSALDGVVEQDRSAVRTK